MEMKGEQAHECFAAGEAAVHEHLEQEVVSGEEDTASLSSVSRSCLQLKEASFSSSFLFNHFHLCTFTCFSCDFRILLFPSITAFQST